MISGRNPPLYWTLTLIAMQVHQEQRQNISVHPPFVAYDGGMVRGINIHSVGVLPVVHACPTYILYFTPFDTLYHTCLHNLPIVGAKIDGRTYWSIILYIIMALA